MLHDDLAEKFKEIMTGKGKLTASDFDDILPQLTAKLGKIQIISYSKINLSALASYQLSYQAAEQGKD